MKQVFVARNPTEAHLVKGLLESCGIAAEVHAETLWGVRGEVPMTPETLPTVWVLDDLEEATALEVIHTRSSSDRAWHCPGCGEEVEPQFSECWKCGTARPA